MRSRHAIVCAASAFAYTHSVAAPAGSAINASNLRCVGVSFALALPLSLSLAHSLCSAVRALHAFLHFAARLHKFRARHLTQSAFSLARFACAGAAARDVDVAVDVALCFALCNCRLNK